MSSAESSRLTFAAGTGPDAAPRGAAVAGPGTSSLPTGSAAAEASEARRTWTVRSALEWTRDFLTRKGDEHPRLSAEWLLCAATGLSRVDLYVNYDRPLDASELSTLHDGVARRGRGEPLQYVTGEVGFRHIVLKCAPGVLIPRPETEILVDEVLAYLSDLAKVRGEGSQLIGPPSPLRTLEVGVGTGCITLSLASECPAVHAVATDISPDAIALATRNRDALDLTSRVSLVHTDLAAGVEGAAAGVFDVLVSNPPYIPTAQMALLPREVGGFEPSLALDGGPDGLDVFRRLVDLGTTALRPGGLLACELHENTLVAASELPGIRAHYRDVRIVRDLTNRNRILCALRADDRASSAAPTGSGSAASASVVPTDGLTSPTGCTTPAVASVAAAAPVTPAPAREGSAR